MAGLADLLGYSSNPLYQALSPYSNTIANAGVGLASGKNWTEGIQNAIGGAAQGNAADIAYQRQLKEEEENAARLNHTLEFLKTKYPDLAEAVEGGYDITAAYNEAFRREKGGTEGSGVTYGVNPIWGQFDDGSFGYGVQGNDGTFKKVDTGGMTPLDPRSLNAEKAAGTAFGKQQGGAVFDLPQAEWLANETIREVDELAQHPGLEEEFSLGGIQQMTPAWPGSQKAAFRVRRDQVVGRTFLQAYETLRGGGQITEVEGRKAQDAMARMSTATSKEEFLLALEDFKTAVRDGFAKLQQQAGMSPFPQQTAPAASGGFRVIGVR